MLGNALLGHRLTFSVFGKKFRPTKFILVYSVIQTKRLTFAFINMYSVQIYANCDGHYSCQTAPMQV